MGSLQRAPRGAELGLVGGREEVNQVRWLAGVIVSRSACAGKQLALKHKTVASALHCSVRQAVTGAALASGPHTLGRQPVLACSVVHSMLGGEGCSV